MIPALLLAVWLDALWLPFKVWLVFAICAIVGPGITWIALYDLFRLAQQPRKRP